LLVKPLNAWVLVKDLREEEVFGRRILVDWVVEHVDVGQQFELEQFFNHLQLLDVVATEVDVLESWQVWHLFLGNFVNLVLAEMEFAEGGQILPAGDRRDHVLRHVKLLELGHRFEGRQSLELVIDTLDNSEPLVTGPSFVDLLELVVADVEILKLRTLESREVSKFVVRDI
jgi:hypothetical protein